MFQVVTLAREYGSGGGAIAQKVAERLGWKLLDRQIIEAIARAAQVDTDTADRFDEQVDTLWHRINRQGLWQAASVVGPILTDVQFFDAETEAAVASEIISDAASKGRCVIVGRGAQCVLHDRSDTLHVLIYAPWDERVARIAKRVGRDYDAEDLLRRMDQSRSAFIRRYFGCGWKDQHLYHMMISSQLGDERVAELIVKAVESGG